MIEEIQYHVQGIVVLRETQYTRIRCGLMCDSEEGTKMAKTEARRGAPALTDKRCARNSFRVTTTYSLSSFLLRGVG